MFSVKDGPLHCADVDDDHFGNEASAQFFFYWADRAGLTEHGTAIPGWLTEKGETVLAELEEILKMENHDEMESNRT